MDVGKIVSLIDQILGDETLYCMILASLISADTNYDDESRRLNLEILMQFKTAIEKYQWKTVYAKKISEMKKIVDSGIELLEREIAVGTEEGGT